jgi:hypothetical protein
MTRTRIESLISSFPKLIPTNIQHTSVETAEVRYVYQPLEDLYIVLITNKASNILQDIDTLHLFARVVSDLCRSADEKEILKQAFELLGAFDEIVSMGYRENVNLTQVRSVLEMESHEEKIQDIIARVRRFFVVPLSSIFLNQCFRTRRPRPRKNSKDGPNNSKCSVGNNRSAPRLAWVEEETATWQACPVATHQLLATRLQTFRLLLPEPLKHLRLPLRGPQLSRELV